MFKNKAIFLSDEMMKKVHPTAQQVINRLAQIKAIQELKAETYKPISPFAKQGELMLMDKFEDDEIRQAFAECKQNLDDCLSKLDHSIELTQECLLLCQKWDKSDA